MALEIDIEKVKHLLSENKRAEALDILLQFSKDIGEKDLEKQVNILTSRNNLLKSDEIGGLSDKEYINIEKRTITNSVLELLKDYEENIESFDAYNKHSGKISLAKVLPYVYYISLIINFCGLTLLLLGKLHFGGNVSENRIYSKLGLIKIDSIGHDFVKSTSIPNVGTFINKAQTEFIYYGPSFHISSENYRDDIKRKLENGVKFRILLFDFSDTARVQEMVFQAGDEQVRFTDYMKKGLLDLLDIKHTSSLKVRENIEIKMTKYIPRQRFYIYDPIDENGETYLIPHLNRTTAIAVPGFLLNNHRSGLFGTYVQSFDNSWKEAIAVDDWLKLHDKILQ